MMNFADLLLHSIVAAGGTVGFSLLFGVPVRYYPYCGAIGGIGWFVYLLTLPYSGATLAVLWATLFVTFLSRWCAVWKRCPATIFLIAGIVPLVPGAGVYWAAYYAVSGEMTLATQHGLSAIKAAVAIVLGIVFIFEIPQSFFAIGSKKRKEGKQK